MRLRTNTVRIALAVGLLAAAASQTAPAMAADKKPTKATQKAEKTPPAPEPGQPLADVREALQKRLKDPDSAKFDGVFVKQVDEVLSYHCGWVNAKNSFGGYVGRWRFVVARNDLGQGRVLAQAIAIESADNISGAGNTFEQYIWTPACEKGEVLKPL